MFAGVAWRYNWTRTCFKVAPNDATRLAILPCSPSPTSSVPLWRCMRSTRWHHPCHSPDREGHLPDQEGHMSDPQGQHLPEGH